MQSSCCCIICAVLMVDIAREIYCLEVCELTVNNSCIFATLSHDCDIKLIIIIHVLSEYYSDMVCTAIRVYLLWLGGQQLLSIDELRILKIVLADHMIKLKENGLSIERAISDKLDITKASVVDCLRTIDQNDMADNLAKRRGKNVNSFPKHSVSTEVNVCRVIC